MMPLSVSEFVPSQTATRVDVPEPVTPPPPPVAPVAPAAPVAPVAPAPEDTASHRPGPLGMSVGLMTVVPLSAVVDAASNANVETPVTTATMPFAKFADGPDARRSAIDATPHNDGRAYAPLGRLK